MTLRIYQLQVVGQCHVLLQGAAQAQSALDKVMQPPSPSEPPGARAAHVDAFWVAAQNVLTAAANLAKALWGSGGRKATQREDLRRSLQVDDTSVLKSSPILRNHLEHFDERIEKWESKSSRRIFVDRNIGDKARMISPPLEDYEIFRNYNPESGELTFWGDSVLLRDVVAEAERILPLAEGAANSW